MEIIVTIIAILGILSFFQAMLSIALIERKIIAAVYLSVVMAGGFVMIPFSLDVSAAHTLAYFQRNIVTLQTISSIQIIEGIFGILLTVSLSKRKLHGETNFLAKTGSISLAPPIMFFWSMFILQSWTASVVSGISHNWLLSAITFSLVGMVFLGVFAAKKLFQSADVLLELKLMFYFFQILVSMFAPVVVLSAGDATGGIPAGADQNVNYDLFFITMIIIFPVLIAGFIKTRFFPKLSINIFKK